MLFTGTTASLLKQRRPDIVPTARLPRCYMQTLQTSSKANGQMVIIDEIHKRISLVLHASKIVQSFNHFDVINYFSGHVRYCCVSVKADNTNPRHVFFCFCFHFVGQKKPYTSRDGTIIMEDRHVATQPLKFSDQEYNLRVLNNLPHHRLKAGQLDLIKDECLTNVEFVITKLEALPVEYVPLKRHFPVLTFL